MENIRGSSIERGILFHAHVERASEHGRVASHPRHRPCTRPSPGLPSPESKSHGIPHDRCKQKQCSECLVGGKRMRTISCPDFRLHTAALAHEDGKIGVGSLELEVVLLHKVPAEFEVSAEAREVREEEKNAGRGKPRSRANLQSPVAESCRAGAKTYRSKERRQYPIERRTEHPCCWGLSGKDAHAARATTPKLGPPSWKTSPRWKSESHKDRSAKSDLITDLIRTFVVGQKNAAKTRRGFSFLFYPLSPPTPVSHPPPGGI
jgi:hypothetical protein